MKNNNFEDQFREAFSAFEPDLSTDVIWENVEPHLKETKKRRFLFFWWLAGGVSLVLFGLGLKQWNADSITSGVPAPEILETKIPTVESTVFFEEEDCTETQRDFAITLISNDQKYDVDKAVSKQKNGSITIAAITNTFVSPPSEKKHSEEIVYTKKESIVPEITPSENEIKADEIFVESENIEQPQESEPPLKKDKTEKSGKIKSEEKKKKSKKKRRIKPLRNKWKYNTTLVTGPVLPLRILSSRGNETYTNFRKDSEKGLGGFTIGSSFIAQSPRGLILSGGLEYIEFRERFRYETMEETTLTSIGTIAVVENADGEITETISGPVSTTTTTTRKVRHTNLYRYFSFPVGIGKAWRYRKNYWRVYGGLDFNLAFAFDGKIFTNSFTDTAPIREISSGENRTLYDRYFKRKAGLGLWLSTEYSRPVTNQLSWLIAPRIKLPLTSISATESEIGQRYVPISVQIGINYLINPPKKKKRRSKPKTSESF